MRGVILGSASPRRRLLLEEAGWRVEQRPPAIDDGRLEIDAGKVVITLFLRAVQSNTVVLVVAIALGEVEDVDV